VRSPRAAAIAAAAGDGSGTLRGLDAGAGSALAGAGFLVAGAGSRRVGAWIRRIAAPIRPFQSLGGLLVALVGVACGPVANRDPSHVAGAASRPDVSTRPVPEAERDAALAELRRFETERRDATDFASGAFDAERFGADPYRVVALPEGGALGVLRGSAELVRLGAQLETLQRWPAPERPSALALGERGVAFAAGELEGSIARYEYAQGSRELGAIAVPGLHSVRALGYGSPDVLYVASEESPTLFVVRAASGARPQVHASESLGRGTLRLRVAGGYLVALCLLEHALVVLGLDAEGMPTGQSWRANADGPFWGLAAVPWHGGLAIAASGVEDHPLDRRIGSFGYVDSFVYVYGFAARHGLERRTSINASEAGVLTPRALELAPAGDALSLSAPGYGSARALRAELGSDLSLRTLHTERSLPGAADVARLASGALLGANALLDAWTLTPSDGSDASVVPVPSHDARTPLEKLGEALEFTTLLAPYNSADGPRSRFTCETCHFEGGIDGRIHHTGRGDVVATTKPLRGLFNDRPYFSRALDGDLTRMVENEFRTAGAGSGRDAWFSLPVSEQPWLRWLGFESGELSPAELRRALLSQFTLAVHPPNPFAQPARDWSAAELYGARAFGEHCEGCHEARLIATDAATRLPFERWHDLIFSEAGPIVWARDSYEKTGIEPLVHPLGARVPSLRRCYAKFPYFTNGSATSLEQLLGEVRTGAGGFRHHAAAVTPGLGPLGAEEQADLQAFLRLL
jgi:hypothetical protein